MKIKLKATLAEPVLYGLKEVGTTEEGRQSKLKIKTLMKIEVIETAIKSQVEKFQKAFLKKAGLTEDCPIVKCSVAIIQKTDLKRFSETEFSDAEKLNAKFSDEVDKMEYTINIEPLTIKDFASLSKPVYDYIKPVFGDKK